MSYTMKDVTEKKGISSHTLRYYEREGILPSIHRTPGGIRYYEDADLETLDLICCLKNTGMPLKEIKEFVELAGQGDETLERRCEILRIQQKSVKEQIEQMNHYLERVTWKLDYFTSLMKDSKKS